jgi:hypothetical protein
MRREQSGFAQLMVACTALVREVRISVEDQQAKAKKREQSVRTVDLTFDIIEGKKSDMGITLEYVQRKVREAVERRDALRVLAESRSPIYTDYPAMVIRDMQECLEALRLIKVQFDSLREHIRKHSKQPNMEQELRSLIAELTL